MDTLYTIGTHMIGWMTVKVIEISVLFQWMLVRLFNMAGVILNQGWIQMNHVINANQRWIDRAIRYFAMVIWCFAMIVLVMILLLIIVLMTSTVLYLVFG